jgi:glutamate-1-semialdehyde 2,1-aminomutase
MNNTKSEELFERARRLIPGGVNSPVRAFDSVGGAPPYLEKGIGSKVIDVDGNEYVDFCGSWGPLILGHAHPDVVKAVVDSSCDGLSFGACNSREVAMAELLCDRIPYLDMVRMVNSGTEATMSSLRLARGYTGRSKIVKFDGCYHGHADYLLVSSGSGLLTSGVSTSQGVTENVISDVLVVSYNDIEAVEAVFKEYGGDIAAVIVEPVAGNMGLIKPAKGFLESLRQITADNGSLLIFDEVISGFRLGATTFGSMIGIEPDLTTLGKIIGGGMPIGAFGGREDIMSHVAPLGGVYQAGTLSGNPVALAAGIATIETLVNENPYERLAEFAMRIKAVAEKHAVRCETLGGMFTIFFTDDRNVPANLADVKKCDTDAFARYHCAMLKRGFYLSPSQYELNFISAAHTKADLNAFIKALDEILLLTVASRVS